MSNLIDLESSPQKVNVSFPLASPLIPSPSSARPRVLSDGQIAGTPDKQSTSLVAEEEESPENNPFDLVMRRVVQYEQDREDPYEKVLETARNFVDRLFGRVRDDSGRGGDAVMDRDFGMLVPACNKNGELISNIEMNFDELPSSDDERTEVTNDNLIMLTDSPTKETKTNAQTERQSEDNQKDIENELTTQGSCSKKSAAATLLLSLKNLIKNENNAQADKALDDLQRSLGLDLDNNSEILKVCLQSGRNGNEDDDGKGEKSEKVADEKLMNNSVDACNKTFSGSENKTKEKLANQTITKSTLINVNSVDKNIKKSLNVSAQLKANVPNKENIKSSPKQVLRSSVVQSTSALKKSPSLKLLNKSSEVSPLRRSLSVSQKINNSSFPSTKNVIKPSPLSTKVNTSKSLQRGKPVDSKAKPKIALNETKTLSAGELPSRRPRIGTYTLSSSTSNVASRNGSLNSNSKLVKSKSMAQVSKSPAAIKEPAFLLRRTSTTLSEKNKPIDLKNKSSSRNSTLQRSQSTNLKASQVQVPDFSREDLNNTKTLKSSTVATKSKVQPKIVSEKKPERRTVLSPLENLNKIASKTKTTSTVLKEKLTVIKKKTSEKENYV